MFNQYNTEDINNKLLYRCNNYVYHVAIVYVVVQFYPWFNFNFPLFLGMVMYNNEFLTKENKI